MAFDLNFLSKVKDSQGHRQSRTLEKW